MRERAFVHVTGPSGCGKTTFMEAVLSSARRFLIAARCVRDDSLRNARETAPGTHPELRRYREAGADGAALFVFPKRDIDTDAFFMTHVMEDYSEGVLLEGDNPISYLDLVVYIAPPPTAGEQLFVRRTSGQVREQRERADALERLLSKPDGVAEYLGSVVGRPVAEFILKNPKLMDDTREKMLMAIAAGRKGRKPRPRQAWAINSRYSGIEHAGLVVVNVREDSERSAGERFVTDLVRLRKDEELFKDILGFSGRRTPITAVVANLVRLDDPGRKKALARTRRALQSSAG